MTDALTTMAAREWRAERDKSEPAVPLSNSAASMMQIEMWERLAQELVASPVVEARAEGDRLWKIAMRERERHAKGDYLTQRHWWVFERELRKAGLR